MTSQKKFPESVRYVEAQDTVVYGATAIALGILLFNYPNVFFTLATVGALGLVCHRIGERYLVV